MTYSVEFTPQAADDLVHIDKVIAKNIANKIERLSQNIENINPAPLKGKFKGKYKLRVSDWKVVYSCSGFSAFGLYLPAPAICFPLKINNLIFKKIHIESYRCK